MNELTKTAKHKLFSFVSQLTAIHFTIWVHFLPMVANLIEGNKKIKMKSIRKKLWMSFLEQLFIGFVGVLGDQ